MDEEKKYDVGIAGGGLAGLCLAIQCVRKGHSVILFEKEDYPFHKVCGEYISNESRNFLQELGVDINNLSLPNISRLQVSDNRGRCHHFPLAMGGFGISRFLLDDLLYKQAVKEGVKVCTGTKVQDIFFKNDECIMQAGGQDIRVKVAAGCFGKRSNLDIKWKRNFTNPIQRDHSNFVGIKYHIQYDHPVDEISLHNFKDGYCGLSKIEDNTSCLCYLTTAKNLKDCNQSVAEMEERILYKNPALKEVFTTGHFIYSQPLAISQISFLKKRAVENHVIMIGDSAGLITPLCGNGMSMAMLGSKLAAVNIHHFLIGKNNRKQMEMEYSKQWHKQFGTRLFIGRNIQNLFGKEWPTSIFLRTMSSFPSLAKALIGATHGSSF